MKWTLSTCAASLHHLGYADELLLFRESMAFLSDDHFLMGETKKHAETNGIQKTPIKRNPKPALLRSYLVVDKTFWL